MKEHQTVSEAGDDSEEWITYWIERLQKQIRVPIGKYLEHGRVWLFFKVQPDKKLVQNDKQKNWGPCARFELRLSAAGQC